jgi:hypothetical protein
MNTSIYTYRVIDAETGGETFFVGEGAEDGAGARKQCAEFIRQKNAAYKIVYDRFPNIP